MKFVLPTLLFATACASASLDNGTPTTTNPPAASSQRGGQIFANTCEGCHNPYALRRYDIANLGLTREQMIARIRNGGPGVDVYDGNMPGIDTTKLSDSDLADLLGYLAVLGAVRE